VGLVVAFALPICLSRAAEGILFVAKLAATSTVEARITGFRDALLAQHLPIEPYSIQPLASISKNSLKNRTDGLRPDDVEYAKLLPVPSTANL
jgi:hypothetical protein